MMGIHRMYSLLMFLKSHHKTDTTNSCWKLIPVLRSSDGEALEPTNVDTHGMPHPLL